MLVVRRVVERGAGRTTVRAGGERVGAQGAERLDVVRAFRQPLRDLGPAGDALRKRSHELPAVAGLDRVRRVDDHLALKQAGVLADQLLDRVEPHREHDDVGIIDRLFHGPSTRVLAEFLRDRLRLPSPVTGEDHPLAAVDEVPRYCRPDLPNSDDCRGHCVLVSG